MIKIDIEVEVFKARVLVLIGSYDEIIGEVPKDAFHQFDTSGYNAMCCYKYKKGDRLPRLAIIHSNYAKLPLLAHEAVHAANFIYSDMGAKADFTNDELSAYFIQYILEKCEERLENYKAETRKLIREQSEVFNDKKESSKNN